MTHPKTLYFIIGLLLTNICLGQRIILKEKYIDTIVITSSAGHYHFDNKGTSSAQSEHYIITFDSLHNTYIVADHNKVYSTTTSRPESSQDKVNHLKKHKGRVIPKQSLNALTKAFSDTNIKPNFENSGLSKERFLYLTNRKHIHKTAKAYKHNLELLFLDKEEDKRIFEGCQSIDTFNLFLSSNEWNHMLLSDYGSSMNVSFIAKDERFLFISSSTDLFNQPWEDASTVDTMNPFNPILNFSINRQLISILPDKFYQLKNLDFPSLTFPYICWYLKRRHILY